MTDSYVYDLDAKVLGASKRQAQAETYLADAISRHQTYQRDGKVTDDLLRATLRLAYLDVAARVGPERVDWRVLKSPHAGDIDELRRLFSVVKDSDFTTKHTCILNPFFGQASKLVGGADADLILDECLIDIKTTKEPRIDIRSIYQLVGYYLLVGLGEIDGLRSSRRPIAGLKGPMSAYLKVGKPRRPQRQRPPSRSGKKRQEPERYTSTAAGDRK